MIPREITRSACLRAAAAFGVTVGSITGRGRSPTVAFARQAAMVVLLKEGIYSHGEVAAAFRRTPGSVAHALAVIEHERARGLPAIRQRLAQLLPIAAPLPSAPAPRLRAV